MKGILQVNWTLVINLRMCNENLIFLFLHQNICCGFSKEPTRWDGSFEHPKHMLKLMGKKIFICLRWKGFVYLNLWSLDNYQRGEKYIKLSNMILPLWLLSYADYQISFANSVDPDQAWLFGPIWIQTVTSSDAIPRVIEFFEKFSFDKNQKTTKNYAKITQ